MYRSFFLGLFLALIGMAAHAGGASSLVFTKSFGAANIALNGKTSLTFSMAAGQDLGNGWVGDFSFTDTLPAGLLVATPNGLTAQTPANCLGTRIQLSGCSGYQPNYSNECADLVECHLYVHCRRDGYDLRP
jgi:hypothetical protein